MICPPCRGAGNEIASPLDPKDGALARAKNMHAQCDGVTMDKTWCDCQHQLESVVRRA